jgi:prepilin-type N-terminal cleavage/methylation domain-containing protein
MKPTSLALSSEIGRSSLRGLTLLELMLTIAIALVLGAITSVSYTGIRNRAERVACTGNLRALHAAFSGYTLDRGTWPQEPVLLEDDGARFYGWLANELEKYGGGREAWLCPTERRRQLEGEGEKEFVGSYTPTMFSPGQQTPWKWENQPWLVERANNHLSGQLMVFPSGKVISVDDFMGGK